MSANRIDRYLLVVPPVIAAAFAISVMAGTNGLPIDDAYIFARYVSNLINGAGYSFNPHEVSFGVTSFFWTIVNAALLKILPTLTFQFTSHTLGIICFVIMVILVELWILRETNNALTAAVGATLCAISPMSYMNAVSGMETMLFSTVVIGVLYLYRFGAMKRPFLLGLAAGLAFLVRPEGLYIPLAIILIELWISLRQKDTSALRNLPLFLLGFLLLSAPLAAYMHHYGAGWMPTTYYGKLATSGGCDKSGLMIAIMVFNCMVKGHLRPMAYYGWVGGLIWTAAALWAAIAVSRLLLMRASHEPLRIPKFAAVLLGLFAIILTQLWRMEGMTRIKALLLLGIILSLIAVFIITLLRNRSSDRIEKKTELNESAGDMALIGLMVLPAAYGLAFRADPLFGGYYNRYIAVMVPAVLILAGKGTRTLFRNGGRAARIIIGFIMVYSLALAGIGWKEQWTIYQQEVGLNEGQRTRAAEWIQNNTPKDAIVMVGYTGLGVVGGRCDRYALDLGALINPDIIAFYRDAPCGSAKRWDRTVAYMRLRDVSYYVTAPIVISDPHADPGGIEGFKPVAEITDSTVAGLLKKITIWQVQLK